MAHQADVALSTYEVIEVAAGTGRHAQARIGVALDWSERLKSTLIGVAARDLALTNYGGPVPAAGDLVQVELAEAQSLLAKAKERFETATATWQKTEWRSDLMRPAVFLSEQARAADLLVIGTSKAVDADDESMTADAGEVILAAGRPVLVVPPKVDRVLARSILVAWKDSREARRALTGALPMLQRAEDVRIFSVGEGKAESSLKDVQAYLDRHGVVSSVSIDKAPTSHAADEIMRAAGSHGADLIVAGAYGYSRMHEWMFGGVTRTLLKQSPIACLLTH